MALVKKTFLWYYNEALKSRCTPTSFFTIFKNNEEKRKLYGPSINQVHSPPNKRISIRILNIFSELTLGGDELRVCICVR